MTDSTRLPYWLNAADRTALAAACRGAVSGPAAGTHDAAALSDVLTELAVAGARDAAWGRGGTSLRTAAGWTPDVLPVRMNQHEIDAVLRHSDDPHLRTVLDRAAAGHRA